MKSLGWMSCAMMWKRKSTCTAQIDEAKWNFLNYCLFWDWQSCRLPWKITLIFQFNENTFDLLAPSLDFASLFQHFCFGKANSVFVFHWRCLNIKEIKRARVSSTSHRDFTALNTKFRTVLLCFRLTSVLGGLQRSLTSVPEKFYTSETSIVCNSYGSAWKSDSHVDKQQMSKTLEILVELFHGTIAPLH